MSEKYIFLTFFFTTVKAEIVLISGVEMLHLCIVNEKERQLAGSFGREGRNNKGCNPTNAFIL